MYHILRYRYHHPGGHDSRLALLPPKLLANARVLDVGCNEGWVSCEIGASFLISPARCMLTIKLPAATSAQLWGARRVVGVDIDDALVRMAWRRRRTLWSHQGPPPLPELASSCATGSSSSTSRLKLKRKRAPQPHPPPPPPEADYFPASCQHMFGPLPIPPTPSSTEIDIRFDAGVPENAFPHNVSFRRADWVNERIPEDEPGYDVILA